MRQTLSAGHEAPNPFRSLGRWTKEEFSFFYPATREIVLKLDGCNVDMLGGINESVSIIAYVKSSTPGQEYTLWISRRAAWKSGYPKMWDCTAGSGLAFSETPLEGIVREAREEIALPREAVRERAGFKGENRVMFCRTKLGEGGCQMQVQYLFKIELEQGAKPDPGKAITEECMEVRLMGVGKVKRRMKSGEFKPGVTIAVLD